MQAAIKGLTTREKQLLTVDTLAVDLDARSKNSQVRPDHITFKCAQFLLVVFMGIQYSVLGFGKKVALMPLS